HTPRTYFPYTTLFRSTKSEGQIKNSTVFVHGYKGTKNSFGNMLKRFEDKYGWGQRTLVYRVSPAGNLDVNVYGKENVTDSIFVRSEEHTSELQSRFDF